MHTRFVLLFCLAACDDGGSDASDGGAAGFGAQCLRFAQTYTGCLIAQCPVAADHEAVLVAELARGCQASEASEVHRQLVAQMADEACDHPYYQGSIQQELTQEGQNNRKLFCAGGPLVAPATCTTHCQTVVTCSEGTLVAILYGEQAACEGACISRPDSSAQIECLAATACAETDCSEE